MRNHVYIAPETITSPEKEIGHPSSVLFWEPLWMMYAPQAAWLEIHCWTAEEDVSKLLNEKMEKAGIADQMTVYHTPMTNDIQRWILEQSADPNGGLRWFTLFLYDDAEQIVLTVGHYGGEIIIYPSNEEEIQKVESFFTSPYQINRYN